MMLNSETSRVLMSLALLETKVASSQAWGVSLPPACPGPEEEKMVTAFQGHRQPLQGPGVHSPGSLHILLFGFSTHFLLVAHLTS